MYENSKFYPGANTYGTCTNETKQYTEGISADETLFARSLAHSITEDVCREKGVSVEKAAQLKKQVEEGTYEPDPMAIARAMYDL